jgi:hypothetical protein
MLAPPGVEQDEFERIVSANPADLVTLDPQMPADDASPARKRMRDPAPGSCPAKQGELPCGRAAHRHLHLTR